MSTQTLTPQLTPDEGAAALATMRGQWIEQVRTVVADTGHARRELVQVSVLLESGEVLQITGAAMQVERGRVEDAPRAWAIERRNFPT